MSTEPMMTDGEAWDFLAEHSLGRLGLTVLGQPEIFPVNFTLDGARIIFRTAEGTKLLGLVIDNHVAFEVDQVDADRASSVVAKGRARQLMTDAELAEVDISGLHPWTPSLKFNLVAIDVTEITGRHFAFGPEPEYNPAL